MLYPCVLCVALFVLCVSCLTVLVNCLVKRFEMCGAPLDIPCMVFHRMHVLCL